MYKCKREVKRNIRMYKESKLENREIPQIHNL